MDLVPFLTAPGCKSVLFFTLLLPWFFFSFIFSLFSSPSFLTEFSCFGLSGVLKRGRVLRAEYDGV